MRHYHSLDTRLPRSANRSIALATSELKTSFRQSRKSVGTVHPTPRPGVSTRSRLQHAGTRTPARRTSSVHGPTVTPSPADKDTVQIQRLDVVSDERTSSNQGMKRLKIPEILRLLIGDEVTIVIPPVHRKLHPEMQSRRNDVLASFRRVILASAVTDNLTPNQVEQLFANEQSQRTVCSGGKSCVEFNVRVRNYPERAKLDLLNPLPNDISHWLGVGNAGLYLELLGHGDATKVLLKFSDLPFVQVHKMRDADAPFITSSLEQFLELMKEDSVDRKLTQALDEAHGDAAQTVQVMMAYYRRAVSSRNGAGAPGLAAGATLDNLSNKNLTTLVTEELCSEHITTFASHVDQVYLSELTLRFTNFSAPRSHLVSDETVAGFYRSTEKKFPTLHFVMATVASNSRYSFDSSSSEPLALDKKKCRILGLFLNLIRTRSQMMLPHYAMVEPLAHWFKGMQQHRLSSGFSVQLRTAFKKLSMLYGKSMATFNEKLQGMARGHAAFDNHNKIISCKNVVEGKSSNNQIGTAMFLREDKPYDLPPGTTMKSPNGVPFILLECSRHSETHLKLTGCVFPHYIMALVESERPVAGECLHDQQRILEGFLYPDIGWDVISVPGLSQMPEVTYTEQVVPPPLHGWVRADASDADILFNHHRPLCRAQESDKVSFTSKRMFSLISQGKRMNDWSTQAFHLKKRRKLAQIALDAYITSNDNFVTLQLLNESSSANKFINLTDDYASELDGANKFETDLVKHVNPN